MPSSCLGRYRIVIGRYRYFIDSAGSSGMQCLLRVCPILSVPVTMTIEQDVPVVTPEDGFESTGVIVPQSKTYTSTNDGSVNFKDFAAFARAMSIVSGDLGFDPACDFFPDGGDGVIDFDDLRVWASDWLGGVE